MNSTNPFGKFPPTLLVDKVLGEAYHVVKTVYLNLDIYKTVAEDDSIRFMVENWDDVQTLLSMADYVVAIGENIEEVLKASSYAQEAKNNAELAKRWATLLGSTVDGTEYSAKYYAQKAKDDADRGQEILEQNQIIDEYIKSLESAILVIQKNEENIVTVAREIPSVITVASDLKSEIITDMSKDMGMVGDDDTGGQTVVTGGNIKKVADNIADVKTVATNMDDINLVADEIPTLPGKMEEMDNELAQAKTYSETATAQATIATTKATESADSASLSKKWATQTEEPVEGELYGSKYYAEQASSTINNSIEDIQAEGTRQVNLVQTEGAIQVNLAKAQVTLATNQASAAATSAANAKTSETNAKTSETNAKASETLAKSWAIKTDGTVDGSEYSAKYYADLSKKLNENVEQKAEEIKNDSGTYFIPSINFEGTLTWTNTGNKENPLPVNIKGPKGDQGEQGWSFNPTAVGILEERTQHDADPKGSSFLDINSGIIYFKLSDTSGDWNEGIPFRGQDGKQGLSANEILMSPDPVTYFDQIYGTASGDIVGSIIISAPAITPAPVENFENALK